MPPPSTRVPGLAGHCSARRSVDLPDSAGRSRRRTVGGYSPTSAPCRSRRSRVPGCWPCVAGFPPAARRHRVSSSLESRPAASAGSAIPSGGLARSGLHTGHAQDASCPSPPGHAARYWGWHPTRRPPWPGLPSAGRERPCWSIGPPAGSAWEPCASVPDSGPLPHTPDTDDAVCGSGHQPAVPAPDRGRAPSNGLDWDRSHLPRHDGP